MKLDFTLSPNIEDIDFLTKKINEETKDAGQSYSFGVFVRNDKNEIIAGCNGSVIFNSIYTDQLWVHPDYRKSGLGKKLMEKVHNLAREKEYSIATAATLNVHNAKAFYEHLGYICDFERNIGNYIKMYFLKKDIPTT